MKEKCSLLFTVMFCSTSRSNSNKRKQVQFSFWKVKALACKNRKKKKNTPIHGSQKLDHDLPIDNIFSTSNKFQVVPHSFLYRKELLYTNIRTLFNVKYNTYTILTKMNDHRNGKPTDQAKKRKEHTLYLKQTFLRRTTTISK
jgi:hypothetical protein